jgi:phosphatidate cytidylyltransferase
VLQVKILVAVVALPVLLGIIYLGGWPILALACVLVVLGLDEFYRAMQIKGIHAVREVGWAAGLGILYAAQWLRGEWRFGVITGCTTGAVLLALITQLWRRKGDSTIANSGATVFGVVYVALLFSFFLRLRTIPLHRLAGIPPDGIRDRMGALVLVMGAVWAMDATAQIFGRFFGTRKPWPDVSPNKTLEGSAAGLLAAMLVTLGLGALIHLPPSHMVVLGAALGVLGQLGDFCKSLIKRELGIKDFGSIIPGHGGVLDRFDSLLFTMPVAYLYFRLYVLPLGP